MFLCNDLHYVWIKKYNQSHIINALLERYKSLTRKQFGTHPLLF